MRQSSAWILSGVAVLASVPVAAQTVPGSAPVSAETVLRSAPVLAPTPVPFLVTGAGTSGGPHVRVLDMASGAEIISFYAYDPQFAGGVRVATADVNGDGIP